MLKVIDILRFPSMSDGYIAAGGEGVLKIIRNLDVLEESYPSVVRFLRPNEFYFTSFWSLVDNKEGRIKLVEAMIENQCSGIGIMPGVYLKDRIDEEILELGNRKHFPILYIPAAVRWGDLISEYGILASGSTADLTYDRLNGILDIVTQLHENKNINELCRSLSAMIHLPIIITADSVYSYHTEGLNVPVVISRLQNIYQSGRDTSRSPVMVRIDEGRLAVVYVGKSTMLVSCVLTTEVRNSELHLLNQIAPHILSVLDGIYNRPITSPPAINLWKYKDTRMYIALLRGENYQKNVREIRGNYILYEQDHFHRYTILLIHDDERKEKNIYSEYQVLSEKYKPDLFVFSQIAVAQSRVVQEISHLRNMVNALSYLRGVFSVDELPLIYMLTYAPQEYDSRLFSSLRDYGNITPEDSPFLTTLRLYVVIQSISGVASFLGIHVNSVKYRINKALSCLGYDEEISLNQLPYVKLLIELEHIVSDNR